METYRSPQVCRAAGVSYRELDHWVRSGAIVPALGARGSGSQRLFTLGDVQDVALVGSLRSAGVPLERCGRAVAMAHLADTSDRWLLLEGESVSIVEDGHLEAALAECDGAVVVDLQAVRAVVPPPVPAVPPVLAMSA